VHQIRLVGPEDEAAHRELLVERLPTTDVDARLAWIYRGNPHGPAHTWIAYAAESGEPAGMTTFFARKLWIDGEVWPSAIGGDMYVRPRFRRRGIGADLFRAAHGDMARLGVRLMFGTPMQPNVTALRASGSTVPGAAVARYARVLASSADWMARLPRPLGALLDPLLRARPRAGTRLEPLAGRDARIDRLWAETRDELSVATVRDAEFYQWRFVDAPSQVQRAFVIVDGDAPIAACALEVVRDKRRIVDLLAPRARWRAALHAIAAATPEPALEMRLALGDAGRRRLWRAGFLRRDIAPMSMLTIADTPRERALHDPARWFLTWADTDIDHA